MKPLACCLFAFALSLPLVATAQQAPDAKAIATRLLDALDAHDYAAATSAFTAPMAAAVPADRLQATWESLPVQAGDASGRGEAVLSDANGTQLVKIPLHYARAELIATVAVDEAGRIAGFLVQPAQAAAAPPPAADAGFSEHEMMIGKGERALPATLAMPDGAGPFPAVVLVHGSGPQDRDETIGPNRVFLDIARGLAAQGIAVLRYDKRSRARPQDDAGEVTIDTETTDDAVLALRALRAVPTIDAKRLFVLGHSQGGMMAPRIAAHARKTGIPVAGLVLMAAPSRKLLDILVEQQQRMAVLDDGRTSADEAAALAHLQQQVRGVRAGGDVADADSPLAQSATYWRSTDAVDPVAEAKALALPMLVLQGARDIQVVDADWQGWRDAFHDDGKVEFKLYPALNHLGIAGEGDGNLAEYATPGHVDGQLIADTAAWIKAH